MPLSTGRVTALRSAIFLGLLLASLVLSSCEEGTVPEEASPHGAVAASSSPRDEEVRFTSGATTLAGTLFWPGTAADWPAVVILGGSDRSGRGPLKIKLAEHMAAHGVAALVYDSPGTGGSTGNALLQTREERVAEARAAVDYLRGVPGVRPTAVGLFGGSEGADVALMAGAEVPRVAFVIPVSGSMGVSILDVLRYSAEKKGYEQGLTHDETAQAATFKEIAFVILSGVGIVEWSLIESRVEHWQDDTWTTLIDLARQREKTMTEQEKRAFLDSFKEVIDRFGTQRWFATVDATNALRRMLSLDAGQFFALLESGRYSRDWDRGLSFGEAGIRCPVLGIWGEEDSFLPPRQSAMRLEKYLADSSHPDHRVIVFPDASHVLTTPGTDEFVPGYLDTIANWLSRRVGSDSSAGPVDAPGSGEGAHVR